MTQHETELIADALTAHDHEDWYSALLLQAMEGAEDVETAIAIADAAYLERPEDDSEPAEDDEAALRA